jgi:hypothetical protein
MKRVGTGPQVIPDPVTEPEAPCMFRSLLAATLLLLCGTALAADGLGKLHIFRDWVVGCDNTRRCEAQGYGSEGEKAPPGGRAALIIQREAGPGQPPALRFAYSSIDENAPIPAAGQAVRVQVGALRFDMPATTAQASEPELPASRVPALLAAVQKGDVVRLSAGSAQWHVSLDGAMAALLKMDDLQGRVGTPGALVRKGTKPESSVPAPSVPVVSAAPLPPTTPADLKLAPAVAALLPHTENECPDFDPAEASLELLRLTPATLLVLQRCWRGAYQTGSRVWQVDDRPPHRMRRLDLPMPDGSTKDTLVSDGLTNEGTLDLHEAAKGRGIGDCWVSQDWTWSGDRLVLVRASESDCRLFEAGGLLVDLWRTQVKSVK